MASHTVSVALSYQSRLSLCALCDLSLYLPFLGGKIAVMTPDIPLMFKIGRREKGDTTFFSRNL